MPEEYKNAIPAGAAITENDQGQILVNGEAWYEPDGDGGWKVTGEKLTSNPSHEFWGYVNINPEGSIFQYLYPVVESLETENIDKEMLGQNWTEMSLPVVIRDKTNPGVVRYYYVPLASIDEQDKQFISPNNGFKTPLLFIPDGDGVRLATSVQEFLDCLKVGQQIEIEVPLKLTTWGFDYPDLFGLIESQGINPTENVLPDGIILPVRSITIKNFKY